MTAPYSPGYNPYSSNELDELERQRQLLSGQAPPPAQIEPAPLPSVPLPAPEPVAAPAPLPTAQPLDLSTAPAALRKGMGVSSVTTQGIPDVQRAKLEELHKQLTGEKLGQIEQAGAAEKTIAERGLGAANARGIEAANQEVYKQRALEDSARKQAELRKAQDEWAAKKEDGSAIKAFGGNESAAVLAGIGMAAGVFSQAMGWQNGNPVKDMFDKTIERSIQAQREEKGSRLNLLAARLGDEKAAELQIRGELHEAIATRIAAQAQGTQHQDALDRLAPLMQDQQIKAKEAQAAAAEALMPKQSVEQKPLAPKGGADPAKEYEKWAAADKALETQGIGKDDPPRVALRAHFGITAPGATSTEQKRADDAAKAKEMTPEDKRKLQDKVDGLADSVQASRELDQHVGFERGHDGEVLKADEKKLDASIPSVANQVGAAAAKTLPWGADKGASQFVSKMRDEDAKKLERIRDQIVFGQAKADGQGALSGGDREVYRAYIPTDSPLSLQTSTAEQWRKRQQAYKNLSAENKELVDQRLRSRGVDPAKEFGSE